MSVASLKASSKGVTALMIVAAFILFGCVLTYLAAAGKIRSAVAELERKETQVEASKQIAQKLEKSKLDYLDAKSRVRCLEASVSTQDYVPTLLKQMEHLGKSVNLKVLAVRPAPAPVVPQTRSLSSGAKASEGNVAAASQEKANAAGTAAAPKQAPKPYDELRVDIEVEGRYMNALDFLYKLTSFPKIVAVNSVLMAPGGASYLTSSGSPTLNIKLNLTAFVLREDSGDKQPVVAGKGGTRDEAG